MGILLLCLANVIYAGDMQATRIREAQQAIGDSSFSAGSAVSSGYSDSIDPSTGTLSASITDATIPGRNGMNVIITRSYSSDIFLSINKRNVNINTNYDSTEGAWEYTATETGITNYCQGPSSNGENTHACPECYPGDSWKIDGRKMGECYFPASDASSWKRAKYLGRGWSMNFPESRLKDPTPLMYGYFQGGTKPAPPGNDQIYQPSPYGYKHVSARGINSISITTNSGNNKLIMPSTYKTAPNFPYMAFWSFLTAYNGSQTYSSEYPPEEPFQPNDPVIRSQIQAGSSNTSMVLFTEDLSPVTITYDVNSELSDWCTIVGWNFFWPIWDCTDAPPPGQAIKPTTAVLKNSDGMEYQYDNWVEFCGPYDDYACNDVPGMQFRKYSNWAENPYPGLYLSKIVDDFGNYIKIDYLNSGSPLIDTITAPGGLNAKFDYYCNVQDKDARLYEIEIPIGTGEKVYMVYEYDPIQPLLKKSSLKKASTGINRYTIPGTTYEYFYDPQSHELIKVNLPTGATIEYKYEWMFGMPVIDYLQGALPTGQNVENFEDYFYQPKRVVTQKKVTNSGELCGPVSEGVIPLNGNTCVWTYDYKLMGKNQNMLDPEGKYLLTTVIDPWGDKTKYYTYPRSVGITDYTDIGSTSNEWFSNLRYLYPEDTSFRSGLIFKEEYYDGLTNKVKEVYNHWSSSYPLMNPKYVTGSSLPFSQIGENGELVGFVASVQRKFPGDGNDDPLDEGAVDLKLALRPKLLASETTLYYDQGPSRTTVSRNIYDRYGNVKESYNYGYVGANPICEREIDETTNDEGYEIYPMRNPIHPYDEWYQNNNLYPTVLSEYTSLQGTNDDRGYDCIEQNIDAILMDSSKTVNEYLYENFDPLNPQEHHAFYGWNYLLKSSTTYNAKNQLLSKIDFEYWDNPTKYHPCTNNDRENIVTPLGLVLRTKSNVVNSASLDISNTNTITTEYDECGNHYKTLVSSKYGIPDSNEEFIKQKEVITDFDASTDFQRAIKVRSFNPTQYNPITDVGIKMQKEATYYPGLAVKTTTNERDISINYIYDSQGRLKKTYGPYDSESYPTVEYDYGIYPMGATEAAQVYQRTKIAGDDTSGTYMDTYYFYDGFGRLIQKRSDNGDYVVVSGSAHDIYGRNQRIYKMIKDTDVSTFNSDYFTGGGIYSSQGFIIKEYDSLGRVISSKDTTDNSINTNQYYTDGHNILTNSIDPLGQTYSSYTDSRGRTIMIDIPSGESLLP